MKTLKQFLPTLIFAILLMSCSSNIKNNKIIEVDDNGFVVLTDEQVENIVKRSYQYVALYNVTNKFAMRQGGWNTIFADTKLKDHTLTDIARPNNDTFYTFILLDIGEEPVIVDLPKFDSKYVSLMVSTYDHYVYVPKSTRKSDFQNPEKIIFYSKRTKGYSGEAIEGVNNVFEANGDFISVTFRVMPHANEPGKFAKIVEQIGQIKIQTLSEFQGKEPKTLEEIDFPQVGKTDADIYGDNFLEVMQFVINHLTFDKGDKLDNGVLAAFKPLGIEPGKIYNEETAVKIDGEQFRQAAEKLQKDNLSLLGDEEISKKIAHLQYQPKGETELEVLVLVSVIGPLGVPLKEAFYSTVGTEDGQPMNALNDYVMKMNKDQLPPANAFWSLTLYDKANGFFIPNDQKKYSVGENAGMKLNADGGIEIYVSAEKPEGVPSENWLPIHRNDEGIDMLLRGYDPELTKLETWETPKAVKL